MVIEDMVIEDMVIENVILKWPSDLPRASELLLIWNLSHEQSAWTQQPELGLQATKTEHSLKAQETLPHKMTQWHVGTGKWLNLTAFFGQQRVRSIYST